MKRPIRLIKYIVGVLGIIAAGILTVLIFGKIDETVEATGRVEPLHKFTVKPKVGGIIVEVLAKEGDVVNTGDPLVVIENPELKLAKEKAEQNIKSLQSELEEFKGELALLNETSNINELGLKRENSRNLYNRKKEAFKVGLIALNEFEEARLDYEVMNCICEASAKQLFLNKTKILTEILNKEREIEVEKKSIQLLQVHLEETVVKSPGAGTVLTPDPKAIIGSQIDAGTNLFEIGDIIQVLFLADVNERDIPRIKPSQKARIFITGLPYRKFKVFQGVVSGVATQPVLTKQGVVFPTTIILQDPWVIVKSGQQETRLTLKAGMTGNVKVVVGESKRIAEVLIRGMVKD